MDGFTFYKSFYETMKKIRKRADRANTALAVLEFMFEDEEPQGLTESCEIAFESFRRMLEKSKSLGNNGKQSKRNQIEINSQSNENQNQSNESQSKSNRNQVKVKVKDKYIPPTVNAHAQEGKGAKMAVFLAKYPLINPDSHVAGYSLDFDALTVAFERSKKYLIGKPHDLSWVAKNQHRILAGEFDDIAYDDGELTAEEMEANRIAFEAKYGTGD